MDGKLESLIFFRIENHISRQYGFKFQKKSKDLAWKKSKNYFIFVDRCISSTQMDQKHAPDPMGGVPGPEICKECHILQEIL